MFKSKRVEELEEKVIKLEGRISDLERGFKITIWTDAARRYRELVGPFHPIPDEYAPSKSLREVLDMILGHLDLELKHEKGSPDRTFLTPKPLPEKAGAAKTPLKPKTK